MYADIQLVEEAVRALGAWRLNVHQQTSSHLYSFLAPKWKGAKPGEPHAYSEADDHAFWDEFFQTGSGEWPYFDPLKSQWRPKTQWHSNTATQRKNRFVTAWEAAVWDDDVLTLAPNYPEIFVSKVLTKKGTITRIPARALAIWLYKRDDLPPSEDELVSKFKEDFGFSDAEFFPIFDSET